MSDISWGKVLGGVALTTGAAIFGAGILPEGAISEGISSAAKAVTDTAASAASSVGLTEMSGKTAAMAAGGALAAAGVTAMVMSGNKDDDKSNEPDAEQKSKIISSMTEEDKQKLAALTEEESQRFWRVMKEKGDLSGGMPPAPQSTDKGRGQ